MVEASDANLPCKEVREVLLPAFGPCVGFRNGCQSMRWLPHEGHVPRGFCGATGTVEEVQLVLVVAEPGDPHRGEVYPPSMSQEEMLARVCRHAYGCFADGKDQFHRNVRMILSDCWPDLTFNEQLRRTWITESVLCSAGKECGPVPPVVYRNCVDRYLNVQLALFPSATVVAVGSKARNRMTRLLRPYLSVGSVAPPGCNQAHVRKSWTAISAAVQQK